MTLMTEILTSCPGLLIYCSTSTPNSYIILNTYNDEKLEVDMVKDDLTGDRLMALCQCFSQLGLDDANSLLTRFRLGRTPLWKVLNT